MVDLTPSQTVGPYFKSGLAPGGEYFWTDAFSNDLVTPEVSASASKAGSSMATATSF